MILDYIAGLYDIQMTMLIQTGLELSGSESLQYAGGRSLARPLWHGDSGRADVALARVGSVVILRQGHFVMILGVQEF